MNEWLPALIPTLITIAVVLGAILVGCMYLVLAERKVSAWMQDRIGPNRVGPFGLFQPVADGIKILLKEGVIPSHVDKWLFLIAPAISMFTTMLAFAVVPFGPVEQAPSWLRFIIAPNIDIGLVFIFAVGSLAVYGVILGGWASNNKYSALGSLRASAQVVSYEIPLGMSVLGVVLMSHTLNLEKILNLQAEEGIGSWNIWYQPLAALIFYISSLAESNRLPFDLSECEQELVGGYHTEYGGLRMVLFFVGEYTHMITISFLTAILFFGGWHFPWIATPESNYVGAWLVKILVLLTKVLFSIFLIMLIRWTIPRFRFDQLMELTWRVFLPLSLANVVAVMFVLQFRWPPIVLLPISIVLFALFGFFTVTAKRMEISRRRRASLAMQ
ncbi:MAG TPA: NADH-quinone oxidoreductase subunit NuoH [Lacipirellulaceae bacterium]|jgi:NADH-quinone oxidoreductase subunit H|nr:NADH-quinone oxidoreductase subunit NuoH [Lacipirellulaceae bacterium]